MNELQVIGTHSSYKRELSEVEQATYDEIIETPGDYFEFLLYSHASIRTGSATRTSAAWSSTSSRTRRAASTSSPWSASG
jgi:hypothetical protein